MTIDKIIKVAIFFAGSAVALGALGAHALKDFISLNQLNAYQTGVRYQLFHALSLLLLALNTNKFNDNLKTCLIIMTIGICLFSFSIYILSLQNLIGISFSFLGVITPFGGILLIASWLLLFFSIKK